MEECGLDWSSEEVEVADPPSNSENKMAPQNESLPSESTVSHRKSLTFTLEPQLFRAASLEVVLSGWCKHWKGLLVESGEELFQLSQPVQSIDTFLSHDWRTSRWMKLMVLLLVFNSQAAAVTSLVVSIAVGLAEASGVASDVSLFFPCYWLYLLVLCFWQRISGLCRRQTMVFLDKLCIHQKDDKMKEKGILGLGAFVRRSDNLLVLWSKNYFNRLWCAYEMGCFLSRERGQVEILPVNVAYLLFLTAILWHVLMSAFHISLLSYVAQVDVDTTFSRTRILLIAVVICPLALVLLPLMNYWGMSIMNDVDQLPNQLQNFRLQDSQCFCCTHHHRHPDTGQELICDRELVYQTLTGLYSTGELQNCSPIQESREDILEKFNRRVQDRLGHQILRRMGVRVYPFRYVLFLIMVCNLATLPYYMTILVEGPADKNPHIDMSWSHRAAWSGRVFLQWSQRCLVMMFSLEISVRLWKVVKSRQSKVAWAIILSPIQLVLVGCFWGCLELAHTVEDSFVPFLTFLVALALCMLLYFC